MNREYNSRVSSKNSERLLKNLKNTTGVYFFFAAPCRPRPTAHMYRPILRKLSRDGTAIPIVHHHHHYQSLLCVSNAHKKTVHVNTTTKLG